MQLYIYNHFPKRHVFDLEIPLISWMFHTFSYIYFNSFRTSQVVPFFSPPKSGRESRPWFQVRKKEKGAETGWKEALALLEWPFDICYPKQIRKVWWMTMTGLWSIFWVRQHINMMVLPVPPNQVFYFGSSKLVNFIQFRHSDGWRFWNHWPNGRPTKGFN